MLLSRKTDSFGIPHTSTCVIHTTGVINDGDTIEVTSPVFSSINFTSKAINMSDSFKVPVRILNEDRQVTNNEEDGSYYGTLVCDDDDVFGMYVRIL